MSTQKPVPFKMITTHELLQWRQSNFWEKEPETLSWLENFSELTGDIRTLIDVGANVGIYSLYWLSLSADNLTISVEPSSENYKLLCTNMEINQYSERANVKNLALSESPQLGIFVENDLRPGASGGQFTRVLKKSSNLEAEQFSISGDQLLENSKGDFLLKIDVDGLDFSILKGFSGFLAAGRIKSVLIETNESELGVVEAFLKEFSFSIDRSYEQMSNHSSHRRKNSSKSERNVVFSLNFS